MSCSNCFNGCSEITSDQCVKYTGINIPILGIKTGDSLSYVEQTLIGFLVSTLDGTGIKIDVAPGILCELVSSNLPTCGDITAVDLFNALIKSVCALQVENGAITGRIDNIDSTYDVNCLEGITNTSSTHEVLQSVITKLCGIDVSLSALQIDLSTNYVKLADLCTLVIACIQQITPEENPTSNLQYLKMVPYTAVEYYGDLSVFDSTGKGIGDWVNIYLCNGNNGTPDKRGRVAVGAIQNVPGPALNPAVSPGGFNPNYALRDIAGANSVTLTTLQMPAHNHPGSNVVTTISPNPHTHGYTSGSRDTDGWSGDNDIDNLGPIALETAGVTLTADSTLTLVSEGGGQAHSNIQPSLACYYIMYIPA